MAIGPIGRQGKQPASEIRGSRPDDGFPEPYGSRQDVLPNVSSWKSSDKSSEPAYIGRSEMAPGHQDDDVSARMDRPFADYKLFDAEPIGSAPQSGEGINATSKPCGRDVLPELEDYYG